VLSALIFSMLAGTMLLGQSFLDPVGLGIKAD
jgi:hypothetical protein